MQNRFQKDNILPAVFEVSLSMYFFAAASPSVDDDDDDSCEWWSDCAFGSPMLSNADWVNEDAVASDSFNTSVFDILYLSSPPEKEKRREERDEKRRKNEERRKKKHEI